MKNKLAEKCSNKYKQTYKFHRLCFDEWKNQVGSQIMAEFYSVQKASAIFFPGNSINYEGTDFKTIDLSKHCPFTVSLIPIAGNYSERENQQMCTF